MALRKRRALVLVAAVMLATGAVAIRSGGGTVVHAFDPTQAPEIQDRLLDATADIELGFNSPVAKDGPSVGNFQASSNKQCNVALGGNVKVNQGCLNVSDKSFQGRGQAQNETSIAANPADPNQLVATSNDYRRGDGTCGVAWSNNGGRAWQDSTLPNGFVRGKTYGAAREYFQGSGDPSVAWDSKGNVYYACQEFMRGPLTTNNPDGSSAIYLYRSTGNGGASWSFPGSAVRESLCFGAGCAPLIDKPLMTVDNHPGSPFQDRIYVTWTEFAADGSSFIYGAFSSNYGHTFSKPVLVSRNSALCPNNFAQGTTATTGQHSNCNENQFSDPFTGADGNLYVAFDNFNNSVSTTSDNHNQVLLARSTDGGATFSAPVLVSNYYDLPDCATYQGGQDPGRACVPEQGSQQDSVFRATNYPSGAVNPTDNSQIVVTFGSYINNTDAATCTPNGFSTTTGQNLFNGVKTSACANKILVSVSNTNGSSFPKTDPTTEPTVNGLSQVGSDQWWQWSGFTSDGRIVASYYDRSYGSDETTGDMDITVSSSQNANNQLSFKQKLVTSSSMPLPTEFPDSLGNSVFFGDYTGLAVSNQANPLWMDTRDVDLFDCPTTVPAVCTGTEPNGRQANDEDLFTDQVGV